MALVTEILINPAGIPIIRAAVLIRLVASETDPNAPGYDPELRAIIRTWTALTDNDGFYSVELEPNDNIDPLNTRYEQTWSAGGITGEARAFLVPDGPGPYILRELLIVEPPAAIDLLQGLATDVELAAHAANTSLHVVLATTPPLALAVAAAAGGAATAADSAHVHPLTGIALADHAHDATYSALLHHHDAAYDILGAAAAVAAAADATLIAHEGDTTGVHGITDTALLARLNVGQAWTAQQTLQATPSTEDHTLKLTAPAINKMALRVARVVPIVGQPQWDHALQIGSSGQLLTDAWVVISGAHALNAEGLWEPQTPTSDTSMLSIVSDIDGPALQIKPNPSGISPGYSTSWLDPSGNYVLAVERDGALKFGAGTRAAMDSTLYRSGALTLRTNSGLSVDGRFDAQAGLGVNVLQATASAGAGLVLMDLATTAGSLQVAVAGVQYLKLDPINGLLLSQAAMLLKFMTGGTRSLMVGRNQADNADVVVLGVDASNKLLLGGSGYAAVKLGAYGEVQGPTTTAAWNLALDLAGGNNNDNTGGRVDLRYTLGAGAGVRLLGGRWGSTDRGGRLVSLNSAGVEKSYLHLNAESDLFTLQNSAGTAKIASAGALLTMTATNVTFTGQILAEDTAGYGFASGGSTYKMYWASGIGFTFTESTARTVAIANGISIATANTLGWSANAGYTKDLILARDAANILAQRNGVNPQTFRLYGTYTDASNYERGKMAWESSIFVVGTEKLGTGASRPVQIISALGSSLYISSYLQIYAAAGSDVTIAANNNANAWRFASGGNLKPEPDNLYDFGATANRIRDFYLGRDAYLTGAPTASANRGLLSLGSGPWDGATAGFFVGHASGTLLAGNAATGFVGNLLDLQVAGVTKFKVTNVGGISISNRSSVVDGGTINGVTIMSLGDSFNAIRAYSGKLLFGTTDDVALVRDAANTLAQRNGVNAQAFRLYNTYTDASNYERLAIEWVSNICQIRTQNAGTGVVRALQLNGGLRFGYNLSTDIRFIGNAQGQLYHDNTFNSVMIGTSGAQPILLRTAAVDRWSVDGVGILSPIADNSYDFGATANRIRNLYVGTQILAADGSDAAPSFAIASNPDTGIKFGAADYLEVIGDGTSYMRLGGQFILRANISMEWASAALGSTTDLKLFREAAGILAQRNGVNAQESRLYRTWTDASNYERLSIRATATDFQIDTQAAGSGGAQHLVIGTQGAKSLYLKTQNVNRWIINTAGAMLPATDNSVDVGGVTADRIRNLFQAGYHELNEMTAPAAGATNSVRLYAEDNGAGKTRLMALFPTGAAVQVAIEP